MISVVMSAYREDPSIFASAVTSILEQEEHTLELVLVLDDPYNDALITWVDDELAGRDNVLVLKNEKNEGLVKSLNRALAHASGDFICRMDADDVAASDRLEKQLSYLQEHDLDLIGGRVNVTDAEGEVLYATPQPPIEPDKVKRALKWNNCLAHPTWFGKREVFAQGYREIPLCEDYDLQIRAVLNGFRLGNCEDVVLSYRLSEGSLSRGSLFRQYLFQKYLTKEYAQGRVADIDRARAYVASQYTERKAQRYAEANDQFQAALNAFSRKRLGSAFVHGVRSLVSSRDHADKIRRLALTSLV